MELTSDFECGGGRRLTRVSGLHWRFEGPGDAFGYNKYFCVQVTCAPDEAPAVLHLDVYADADAGEAGARMFRAHYPSHIWRCVSADWLDWQPLANQWPDAATFHPDHIELHVPVEPGTTIWLASGAVLRYSELLAWIDSLPASAGALEVTSLGESTEGRRIPLLRLGGDVGGHTASSPTRPKLLVFAGEHPAEHCGPWACRGIVEYLLSPIAEARQIRERFDVAVVPMINPDGNVRGLSGANAQGFNLHLEYTDAASGTLPRATENRLLWEWVTREFPPDVLLHFHGYGGWRAWMQPPYEGILRLDDPEAVYPDPQRRAAYEAIRTRLLFETPAYSGTWRTRRLDRTTLDHQLALRFGTLQTFYEISATAVGAIEHFRRGPQVLGAVTRALLHDTRLFDGHDASRPLARSTPAVETSER